MDKARQLQRTLFLAAKKHPKRRFHALYDKLYRMDIRGRLEPDADGPSGSSEALRAQGLGDLDEALAHHEVRVEGWRQGVPGVADPGDALAGLSHRGVVQG